MPQLDMLIMTSQSIFLVFFFIGYIYFLEKILPIISFELKMKELIELTYLNWLEKYIIKTITNDKSYLITIKLLNTIYNFIIKLSTNKDIIFGGTYGFDLISLRNEYQKKYSDRIY